MPYLLGMAVLELSPAPRLPPTRRERQFVGFAIGLFAAFLAVEIALDFTYPKLGILFMAAAWVPMLAIHELGHAAVARLVGWRVTDIVVGFGRELWRFRAGETLVRIQLAPFGGYVVPSPRDLSLPRLKALLIYAAGPGIEAMIALGLWLFDPELFSGADEPLRIAMRSIVYVVGISLFFNLLPMPTVGGMNDGLGILMSLTLRKEGLQASLIVPELREATRRLILEDPAGALEILDRARRIHGEDARLLALTAVGLANAGKKRQAQEMLERADQRAVRGLEPEALAASRGASMNAYRAWTYLEMGDPGLGAFALKEARQAFERSGGDVLESVLYGRALLAKGQNRQAYGALMCGFKRATVSEEEGLCSAYLALAAHRALAGQEARSPGTPYIASDHPARFLMALDRYIVGERLKRSVLQEFRHYGERPASGG